MANQKKISELPIISALSGSAVSVIPVVVGGTTNQIPAERFSEFVNAYNATTSSNTFIGNQIVTGSLTLTGDAIIGGNVEIAGMITAQQYNVTYVSSSIQYQSGSTEFGDTADDTHIFTGTIILNGDAIGLAELNAQTASQNSINLGISSVTGAFATELGSIDSHIIGVSIYTSSNEFWKAGLRGEVNGLEAYTSSLKGQAIVSSSTQITNYHKFAETASANTFYGIQTVSGSININGGQFSVISGSGDLTSSIGFIPVDYDLVQGASVFEVRHINNIYPEELALKLSVSDTAGTIFFEKNGSVYNVLSVGGNSNNLFISRDTRLLGKGLTIDDSLLVKGVITGSILATNGVVSSSNQLFELNGQTGSQDLVNLGISSVTGSLIGITNGLMAFTASLDSGYATDDQLYQLYQATSSIQFATASLNTQTGSQDLVNLGISSVTGSLIGITNGLMAFTAALDSTYATDAQLYQLYQATASIQFATASLNTQTGSQDSINFNISVVTSSIDAHILKQATQTGSQDLVNLGISTYTGSQNVINTSVDSHILKQATQTGSQDLVNLGVSSITGSLIGITNGLMAFTAALDSTYATDAQLYQLYQATASIQFATASLNVQTGSQDSINFNISVVTSSIDSHILKQATQTGSQDLVNYNISIVTSSIDAHILKQATQTGSQDLVNLGISTFTGSLRSEVNLIEAYTASLKAAAIVSSSQQVQNYFTFAKTGSANTFYGNQSITGDVTIGAAAATTNRQLIFNGVTNKAARIKFQESGVDKWLIGNGAATETGNFEIYNANGQMALSFFSASSAATFIDNIVIGTAGKGIDFSATSDGSGTTTSELLDDYEEGTFTPTIIFGTSGTATYSIQSGFYTKIGRQVTVVILISFNDNDGTGVVSIGGLPFTSISTNYCRASGAGQTLGMSGMTDGVQFQVPQNNTKIDVFYANAGATTQATEANTSTDTDIYCTITYFTA